MVGQDPLMVGGYIQDLDQDLVTGVAADISGMDRETDFELQNKYCEREMQCFDLTDEEKFACSEVNAEFLRGPFVRADGKVYRRRWCGIRTTFLEPCSIICIYIYPP